jgi:hypothetical protein
MGGVNEKTGIAILVGQLLPKKEHSLSVISS